ncbi:unnamed protein product [Moneuplotes crassus]|uniref:Transmembrane protein n=1 Tax=Euplotes crassus TaxID=5936 RepID=A0AAD2D5I7_EUPCR|nr:unnamed protein product [Moneuplotes crassus]
MKESVCKRGACKTSIFKAISLKIVLILCLLFCATDSMKSSHFECSEDRICPMSHGLSHLHQSRLQVKLLSSKHTGIKDSHILVIFSAVFTICIFIIILLRIVDISNYATITLKKTHKKERIRKANLINERLYSLGIIKTTPAPPQHP